MPPRQARSGSTRDWTRWSCSAERRSPTTSRQATSSIGQSACASATRRMTRSTTTFARSAGAACSFSTSSGRWISRRCSTGACPRSSAWCRSTRSTPRPNSFERRQDRGLHSGRPDRRRRARQSRILQGAVHRHSRLQEVRHSRSGCGLRGDQRCREAAVWQQFPARSLIAGGALVKAFFFQSFSLRLPPAGKSSPPAALPRATPLSNG